LLEHDPRRVLVLQVEGLGALEQISTLKDAIRIALAAPSAVSADPKLLALAF